jgi:hypothetical protein
MIAWPGGGTGKTPGYAPPHFNQSEVNANTAIDSLARECFEQHGLYPISFCLPRQKVRPFRAKAKTKPLSFIVPGDRKTFVFTDEESYINEYQTSRFARTWKKGGWDCVRHLEIMTASALPLFENIEACPRYTMAHYPKEMFREINGKWEKMNDADFDQWLEKMYGWFTDHLVSDKMVDYMLRMTNNEGAESVLFVDEVLGRYTDCQSAMILGGLKNKFGKRCELAFPADVMYHSRPLPVYPKWWKTNFNIYQVLDDAARSPNEDSPDIARIRANIRQRKYDVIVYGSITRSTSLFNLAADHYPKERLWCINGEDDIHNIPAATFRKKLDRSLHNFVRRNTYCGTAMYPLHDRVKLWRKLLGKIQPRSTVFMRELVV